MILHVPDLPTLRLALTAVVPAALGAAPAASGRAKDGSVWLRPSSTLPAPVVDELRRLGVTTHDAAPVPLTEEVLCWAQLLPLESVEAQPPGAQTPVLFDLPAAGLAELVAEILRLGNDRQGFRWLEDRVLLRVLGPPYYSLLRALDSGGRPEAPAAFVESAPRVWVQLGYRHPLGEHLAPPPGRVLLLRPPLRWLMLDEAPFRDIYEVVEFTLPDSKAACRDVPPTHRLTVPLRLTRGGATEAAELWVVRDRPLEQLDELVASADDQLLRQLSFAVAERDGRTLVALRVRPSRTSPPELALEAIAYRTYLKLPNLFLPCGQALHPPLRRDAVRKLLADEPARVTWLHPHGDGRFTPESVPDEAFRPLADWVDYVLDHDRQELALWVESTQFDFEPFICADDQPDSSRGKKAAPRERTPKEEKGPASAPPAGKAAPRPEKARRKKVEEPAPELHRAAPSELQKRLHAAEEAFLIQEGPLDAPERRALWPTLATLNAALGHADDASLCWLATLWSEEAPEVLWNWFRAEASTVPLRPEAKLPSGQTWVSRLAQAAGEDRQAQPGDLEALLRLDKPLAADVGALAAYLTWSATQPPMPMLRDRLNALRQLLESHEPILPVRAVWLAWLAVHRLAGGDVLALARARDRLLERLYHQGLRPEHDLPGFLRYAGQAGGDRARNVRAWMQDLNRLVHRWLVRGQSGGDSPTSAYADLMFSFGLARLGELNASRSLLDRATGILGERDQTHSLLLQTFAYRIRQAQESKPHGGPWPAEYLEELEQLRALDRERRDIATQKLSYPVERLRQMSRILEPDQEIDAYRYYPKPTPLDEILRLLPDLHDREDLTWKIDAALRVAAGKGQAKDQQARQTARALTAGLEQTPRVGEALALKLLERVPATLEALPPPLDHTAVQLQARLLQKSLFVAAHFDQVEQVHQVLARFQGFLQALRGPTAVQELDGLASQSFRGLRKLGMRDEIELLLQQFVQCLLDVLGKSKLSSLLGRFTANPEAPLSDADLASLRVLLQVAAGWLYFGRDQEAEPVLNTARVALFDGNLAPMVRCNLTVPYLAALSQAPTEYTRQRIEELFHRLDGLSDVMTTSSHYGILQLRTIEATIRAVVGDDFTAGAQARRWLEDDEFLVRRRIHHDLRAALARAEGFLTS